MLLKINLDAGHGGASGRFDRLKEVALDYAFAIWAIEGEKGLGGMIIRLATAADAPALAEIYGHHVREGLGTFEEEPPSAPEMAMRLAAVLDKGLPWLVADDGGVAGYAYAAPFRTRAAYRFVVEDSVYVAPDRMGSGVGKTLLTDVIARCEARGLRQMIAIIGDSGNAGSMRLHSSLGFKMVGLAPAVGWKHGRWVDVVWMQRALGAGGGQPPAP